MNWSFAAVSCAVAAGLLTLVGLLAPGFVGGRLSWSDADALRYSDLAGRLHAAGHDAAHAERSRDAAEMERTRRHFEAIQAEFDRERRRLDSARNSGAWWGSVLKWLGVACAAAGGGALAMKYATEKT
jgi:hypothetical protein